MPSHTAGFSPCGARRILLPERSRRERISGEYDSPSSENEGMAMAESEKSTAIPLFTMIAAAVVVATWAIVVAVHTYGL